MIITQVCAYANWPDESFEVWKWFEADKPQKEIVKNMESLFTVVFSRVVQDKKLEDLKNASKTIGRSDIEKTITFSSRDKIVKTAKFAHYLGECLDKKRLQYFAPKKILSSGIATVANNSLKIKYEKPKSGSLTKSELELLVIRKELGDDPKRVRSDAQRVFLGKEWNYLFNWKESFGIGKSGDIRKV
ncbi:MAG: hypothetical protein ACREGI_03415 [Candidatus Levyibacteriota bacterium]